MQIAVALPLYCSMRSIGAKASFYFCCSASGRSDGRALTALGFPGEEDEN